MYSRAVFGLVVVCLILLNIAPASAFSNNINLTWVDEDTNAILAPTIVINGDSVTVTNGVSDYNTNSATAEVVATLNGYLTKTLNLGFPGDLNLLYTTTLLVDTNAQSINFKQRTETNETLITDANILIIDLNNSNLIGAAIIGSDSLFTAVLKPSGKDYNFMVTGSGITDFNYSKVELVVNNVIDERTLIDLGGIGTVTVSNPGSFIYGTLEPSTTLLSDDFTGANGDPPDASIWFIYNEVPGNGIADIEDNDLNLYINGSNNTIGVKSDINILFEIGDVKEFEFISVARPVGAGSEQYGAGWVVDNNANPQTAEIGFKINRSDTGTLTLRHGPNLTENQLDGGAGEIKLKITVTRTTETNYKSEFFINDTNLMQTFNDTVAHHLYKVTLFARAGAGGPVTGKYDDALLRELGGSTVFPFTNSFYSANVDFNSTYFSRTYKFHLKSTESFTLQPYLVSTADGISTTIHTILSTDVTEPVTDILIITKKQIAGTVEVESIITDSKGESLQSYIVGDSYVLEFYNLEETLLFTKNIDATSSNIWVYMTEEILTPAHIPQKSVVVTFNPSSGRVSTLTTITQAITVFPIPDINIVDANVFITNNDIKVFDENFSAGIIAGFSNSIVFSTLGGDANFTYEVTILATLSDGSTIIRKTTYTLPVGIDYFDLLNAGTKEDIACDDTCPFLIVISIFITVIIVGAFGIRFREDVGKISLTILGIIVLGAFMAIGWIPFWMWALMSFSGFTISIGLWRGN